MKLAIAGKGGVGKTTFSGSLARLLAEEGGKVFAIDADPNRNLAASIGFDEKEAAAFVPLVEMKALIEERTGAAPGAIGGYFRLNPKVDDLPDRFKKEYRGVMLLNMGALKEAASGCYCSENTFLKTILMHLIIQRDETVILDMEAGFEHLTRGTCQAVDSMIIVVDTGRVSIISGKQIHQLGEKIGIKKIYYVGNKVNDKDDKDFIEGEVGADNLLGFISRSDNILKADRARKSAFDFAPEMVSEIKQIKNNLFQQIGEVET